jgi:putative two-component system response regulator
MALADVYDALRYKRCYKEAFSHARSRDIILAAREHHFDPVIVDAFMILEQPFEQIHSATVDEAVGNTYHD